MKTAITSALIALPLMAMAQNKVIENPVFGSKSIFTTNLNIERIEVKKDTTKLAMTANLPHEGQWAQISGESYIFANGQRLPLLKAEGIKLNEPFYAPSKEDRVRHFTLSFPEVDKNIERIDFIESDCPNCFKIWNIAISDEAYAQTKAENDARAKALAAAKSVKDDGQHLCEAKLMIGKSTFKFRFEGYNKDVFGGNDIQALCYINNPLTGHQESYFASLSENGSFELELPLVLENQTIGLQIRPIINTTFLARCNGSEEYIVDLSALVGNQVVEGYFMGDNADINNVLAGGPGERGIDSDDVMSFNGKTAADFKAHVYSLGKKAEEEIDAMDIPIKAKEYLKIDNRGRMAYYLLMGDYLMENIYRQSNNIPPYDMLENYERPVLDTEYFKFAQDLNLNSIDILYTNESYNIARNLVLSADRDGLTTGIDMILQFLKDEGTLDATGEKVLEIINTVTAENRNTTEEENGTISSYMQNLVNNGVIDRVISTRRLATMDKIIGTKSGIIFDLFETVNICSAFENNSPVSDKQIAKLANLSNPIFAEYAKMRSAEITAAIEAEKARGGYFIHQSNETEADALLVDLIKDHAGKVVFIDIWATWCGPCRHGIEKMKPFEAELEAKGVDFVYVTDESSPENLWNNMIVEMKGSHYRLQSSVLNKLKDKFHFGGVPSYIYVNRKGEVAHTETGFGGVEYVVNKLNELLAE